MNTIETIKPQLNELFQAFQADLWISVREAVDRTGTMLKKGGLEPAIHATLGEQLLKLARHGKWEVRKSLAHASLYLRHESFFRIMAALDLDDNAMVRTAARRTLSRRSDIARSDSLRNQHGDRMLKWLTDLEAKHGLPARNAARKATERLNAQFIKELNHEFIKVISPLDASLEHINNGLHDPDADMGKLRRHAQRALDRSRFLFAIMNSLRALTEKIELDFQMETVLSMIDEAVHLVHDRAPENQCLSVDVQISPEIALQANRHLLLQAFSNILQNSLEAYPDRSHKCCASVAASIEENGLIRIVIADQGNGMPEEAVNDAFQLFSTSKPRGTGFGLALAKKIIESDHGGSIHLASSEGVGTTITIFLPQDQEDRSW
ncbi:MAG: HAMP domain-containing histidine kinase [Magnetococcales bacterium]|nr:HAMP domain-containing histidine kinase [Magnetococcales bacterium]